MIKTVRDHTKFIGTCFVLVIEYSHPLIKVLNWYKPVCALISLFDYYVD